jgi:hypothetical protein
MSLQLKAVDRLFERLMATYGREFMGRYEGQEIGAVKSIWAHELAGFSDHMHSLAWALEHLPERAPNVIEFRNLARRAPTPDVPRLPEPAADPARVAAELARLAPARKAIAAAAAGDHDPKAWARRLLARHAAGDRLRPIALRFAHEALRLHPGDAA